MRGDGCEGNNCNYTRLAMETTGRNQGFCPIDASRLDSSMGEHSMRLRIASYLIIVVSADILLIDVCMYIDGSRL